MKSQQNRIELVTRPGCILGVEAGGRGSEERSSPALYEMDVRTIRAGVNAIFGRESELSGFRLAHRVDRNFLDNFFNVISWLFDSQPSSRCDHSRSFISCSLFTPGFFLTFSKKNSSTRKLKVPKNSRKFGSKLNESIIMVVT